MINIPGQKLIAWKQRKNTLISASGISASEPTWWYYIIGWKRMVKHYRRPYRQFKAPYKSWNKILVGKIAPLIFFLPPLIDRVMSYQLSPSFWRCKEDGLGRRLFNRQIDRVLGDRRLEPRGCYRGRWSLNYWRWRVKEDYWKPLASNGRAYDVCYSFLIGHIPLLSRHQIEKQEDRVTYFDAHMIENATNVSRKNAI